VVPDSISIRRIGSAARHGQYRAGLPPHACGAPSGRRSLRNKDQELLLKKLPGLLHRRVRKHINEYAAVIGIHSVTPQFEKQVTRALFVAISGTLERVKPERSSVVRKQFLRVGKELTAAVKILDRLRITFDNLSPSVEDWLKNLDFPERVSLAIVRQDTPPFYMWASVGRKGRMEAEALRGKDKGGAPQMYPFKMLILALALAFENATKRKAKVTYDPVNNQFKGLFLRLVETVLPLTRDCATELGQTFPHPQTPHQRGRYVLEWTRSGSRRRA
jgi:hypothetical protein